MSGVPASPAAWSISVIESSHLMPKCAPVNRWKAW
jgi:hypothetical protein